MPPSTRIRQRPHVAVVGGSDPPADVLGAAEQVGRLLAEGGAVVVTGGRSGVAEAASRGASRAGGLTIGILPGHDRRAANDHVLVAIATGLGDTRNALVAMNGDAVIALDGAYGTLSEVALALVAGTPVVGLGAWELRRAGRSDHGVIVATSPADAVARAVDLAARARPRR